QSTSTPTPTTPPPRKTLDLNTDDFLPISRGEVKRSALLGGTWLWRNVWFGRRDLIPPADDERTKLIDRALVTHGLLTPEQLVEIHQVGDEMERRRNELDAVQRQAARAGQAAVEADRERRGPIKKQKKDQAAAPHAQPAPA